MKTLITCIVVIATLVSYSLIGISGRVEEIKKRVPKEMEQRNWKILRYEGYEYGSWGHHGGKVWYHVANIDNTEIQYRVYVTLWENELMFYYGNPEVLTRLDIQPQ